MSVTPKKPRDNSSLTESGSTIPSAKYPYAVMAASRPRTAASRPRGRAYELATPPVAWPIAALDLAGSSSPDEASAVHSFSTVPRLRQTGAFRMRLCRHACWTWTAADRALPASAVRPGDGLAGLLSQPQALPRRRPVLVGARHRAARARLAALAGLGRCDDWVAGGVRGRQASAVWCHRPSRRDAKARSPRFVLDRGDALRDPWRPIAMVTAPISSELPLLVESRS